MPNARVRCRYCEPDDPLAQGYCAACLEVSEDMLLAEAERYPDVLDAVLALAGAYSRAEVRR
jgi:hypothetical protein